LSKTTRPGDLAKRWKNVKVKGKGDIHALLQQLKQEGLKFINLEVPCQDCASFDYTQETEFVTKESANSNPISPTKSTEVSEESKIKQPVKPYVGSGDSLDVNYILE